MNAFNIYGNQNVYCYAIVYATAFTLTSDQSIKDDVKDIDLTPVFDAVECKSYNRSDKPELGKRVGFIAQDIQKACTDNDLPNTSNQEIQQEDGTTLLGLDYNRLGGTVLRSVCKRQQAALAALEARLRAIEQAIENA